MNDTGEGLCDPCLEKDSTPQSKFRHKSYFKNKNAYASKSQRQKARETAYLN